MSKPRLVQTYLVDGTLEGIRVIDPEGDILAFAIPRLKLAEAKSEMQLTQPAIYVSLNAEDNRAYIGESENFLARAAQHVKSKGWWTSAVAIVHKTNDLEKGDVKYLESLVVERARSGSMHIENSTIPPRNNIQRFKLHKLDKILDDIQFALASLGYDILSLPNQEERDEVWHCKTKLTNARAVFRAGQFVVLAGSLIDKSHTPSFEKSWPEQVVRRRNMFVHQTIDRGDYVELANNLAFKSPNQAGGIVTGRSINAWTIWKNAAGQTMDEVMRRGA